jgi:tetratricopeptide (TPR) repeat protein
MLDLPDPPVRDATNGWLRLAPRPRPRPAGIEWDVFLSYRSVNRTWALALFDSLRELDYHVFLDQFVLPAGVEIEEFLRDNLKKSASGALIWTGDAETSRFVKGELAVMRKLAAERPTFKYVLARLDASEPPLLEANDLYVDFTPYPEGPRGGELLRLLFGLRGEPLSAAAVREIHEMNLATTALVRRIGAAKGLTDPVDALLRIAKEQPAALSTISLPCSVLVEALIGLGANDAALAVVTQARAVFKESLRLQQLEALAHRRLKRFDEAFLILQQLYEQGHRDPETVGILGATWMQRYKKDPKRSFLERSQKLYAEAFRLVPDSYYVGINAAAKALLLGMVDEARRLIELVLPLVSKHENGKDYWGTATHAEARLIHGEYELAKRLYRAAVVEHLSEEGSIGSTRTQAADLLTALSADETTRARVLAAFSLD